MEINVLTYSYKDFGDVKHYKDEFEEYAKANNSTTTINVESMKYENPTSSYTNFKLLVESSLKKSNNIHNANNEKNNNTKFDIYFYDMRFTNLYGPYLLNLKEYLSKEFIEMYNSDIIEKTAIYNDELVGLVIIINK